MTTAEKFDLAMCKVKENDHYGAIALFNAVLVDDESDANAYCHRGIAYLNLEAYDLSLADMNKAVELDPEYGFRYQARAYLKTRLKDHDGALADYQKAVDLDPSDPIAYNNLALAQEQMGWTGKAKENFDKSDNLQGIQTTEERAKARIDQAVNQAEIAESQQEQKADRRKIAQEVFTKKSTFKEFISFIGNGFKLKKDDKGGES